MTQHRGITHGFVAALFSLAPAMQDVAADTDTLIAAPPRERITQFIVKVKTPARPQSTHSHTDDEQVHAALARRAVERVLRDTAAASPARSRRSVERVIDMRPMSGAAHVVMLGSPITDDTAAAIAAHVQAQPEIEYAEADYRLYRELAPSDPLYAKQWAYGDAVGAARFERAWDTTTGTANMVVAAIDTGYRPHPDLMANLLPGYDFITDPVYAASACSTRKGPSRQPPSIHRKKPGPGRTRRDCLIPLRNLAPACAWRDERSFWFRRLRYVTKARSTLGGQRAPLNRLYRAGGGAGTAAGGAFRRARRFARHQPPTIQRASLAVRRIGLSFTI